MHTQLLNLSPYKPYNCSIIILNPSETSQITNNKFSKTSILITFFVSSSPNKRYGTMNWIGLIDYEILLNQFAKKTNANFWIIKPHLIQNDLGPKCADLRLFKTQNNINIIGYTRVASQSNTPNIADYYVRAAILETKINNSLYVNPRNLYHFREIDGGCFPSKIANNYHKFKGNTIINNIEFHIKNNPIAKNIIPHKSKHPHMPNSLKLNGIEVSFSKINSNENPQTHISTKNIIPLQHKIPLNNSGCFVDFFPPKSNSPILTIQNLETGQVYHTDSITNNLKSYKFRGSTPFIELNNNMWLTIVHKRINNKNYKYGIYYEYYATLYNSKTINLFNNPITLPNICIKEYKMQFPFKKDFIYITGLVVLKEENNKLDCLISYGISDANSGLSLIELKFT